jgi:hypothetical protein
LYGQVVYFTLTINISPRRKSHSPLLHTPSPNIIIIIIVIIIIFIIIINIIDIIIIINIIIVFDILRFLLEIEGKSKFAEQTYTIATNAGKIIPKTTKDGSITVDMGSPILQPDKVPTTLAATKNNAVVEGVISACGVDYKVNCVSMGNPHAVYELF